MSECRWCDTCNTPFSTLDPESRRVTVHQPETVNGIRRGTIDVERDQCGACTRDQEQAAERRRQLTLEGGTKRETAPDGAA